MRAELSHICDEATREGPGIESEGLADLNSAGSVRADGCCLSRLVCCRAATADDLVSARSYLPTLSQPAPAEPLMTPEQERTARELGRIDPQLEGMFRLGHEL